MTLSSPVVTRGDVTASTVSMTWPKVDGAGKYWIYQTLPEPPYNTVSGVKAAYFDGSGDCLRIPLDSDLNFGSGNFTIDFWYYKAGTQVSSDRLFQTVDGDYVTAMNLCFVTNSNSTVQAYFSTNGTSWTSSTGTFSVSDNVWMHLAVVRNGTAINIYKNGVSVASCAVSGSLYFSTGNYFVIGGQTVGSYRTLNGYIDEFRISKGYARWTGNFDVPTAPYVTDEYTKLLLHTNGTGNSFVDSSGLNKTVTAYGNATQVIAPKVAAPRWELTATPNMGQTSAYFDGNGDYLTIPDSPDFYFGTEDFTIDFWINRTTNTPLILGQGGNNWTGTGGSFQIFATSTRFAWGNIGTAGNYIDFNHSDLGINNWHHYCLVKSGANFKISRGNSPHFNGEMKARLGGEFFPNNMEYFPVFKSVLL